MADRNQTTHEVFVETCGMTSSIFRGSESVCRTIASDIVGKPFNDEDGKRIGIVERSWVEGIDSMTSEPRTTTDLPYTARLDAAGWWDKHKSHVDKLIASQDDGGASYPPSGSDRCRPELWRAPHWRWLKELVSRKWKKARLANG